MSVEITADAKIFLACGEGAQQSILLLEQCYDQTTGEPVYDLPGGCLEQAESGLEAVVRETREETGLHLDPAALVRAYATTEIPRRPLPGQPERALGRFVIREYFLGRLQREPGHLQLSHEHSGSYWVPEQRLLSLPGVKIQHKSAYQRVEDFNLWDLVRGYTA